MNLWPLIPHAASGLISSPKSSSCAALRLLGCTPESSKVRLSRKTPVSNPQHNFHTDHRAGKYLTFELANEAYGIEILKVREIIGMMEITQVPRMPAHVRGVINLRGKVIPVIDLRLKFDMTSTEQTPETCIIVVDVTGHLMGLQVDKVSEVLDITSAEIEDAPIISASVDNSFILGMGKAKGRVNILLNIDEVLSPGE
ncbi:MAG: chemotaxis protein CheW [bacterium]|nr:chemotaxis protein CheW [bacterium]